MKRLLAFVATKSFTLIVATVVLACSSCSGGNSSGSSSNTTPPPVTVLVTPASATVQAGATAQFTATVTNDGVNKGVTWTVSCSTASCGSVSATSTASGVATIYSAPATPGSSLSVTLTATSVADGTRTASANVTVPAPISVSVAPGAATVQPGTTARFTATVVNDPANAGVTWNVSCSPALTGEPGMPCGNVFPTSTLSGAATTYTAPTAGDLIVTITAASMTNGNSLASATIIVRGIAVSVVPGSATLKVGGTAQFTATVINDATNQGVTWTLLYTQNGTLAPCPSAAVCGSVSPTTTASGAATTYSAPTAPLAGNFEVAITATAMANSAASAQAFATVSGITVSITPSTASIPAGVTQQFTATVSNDSTSSGVNWTLTQGGTPCSPNCGTLSASATASGAATTYTAPAPPPMSNLTVTITATSVALNSASASATVTVLAIAVSVTPFSSLLPGATTQQFTATVNNDPTKGGVIWALTQNGTNCTATACGAISSSSANPVTYTAPATVSATATVTLTATSVTDATKLASATIILTIGTVKIVPATLDFGKVIKLQTSSPQATTLTNTGNATLSIASVMLTGANPQNFSIQSNNCGPGVAAGGSCTIAVTFSPRALALYRANLSISDNSPDSPQQVSLLGTGVRRLANGAALRSTLASSSLAVVPSPTGPNSVGTRVMHLVDPSRDDPYLASGAKRELLVRFWYPASLSQDCKLAPYTSPAVWSYFSNLLGLPLPEVQTNSCQDATIAAGLHPVVVFTPGYTCTFTDYTFIFEDLASRGYVVASVDHTYEATAVEFPDGRFVKSFFGSYLLDTLRGDSQQLAFAVSVRLGDLKFVMNDLEQLNVEAGSPFVGKLDISRIALAGHSLGGLTTMLGVQQEPRFRAGIILDSGVPSGWVTPTYTAVLILAAGRERWSEDDRHLWEQLLGPRFAVNLKGSEHEAPSDAVWLTRGAIKTGQMGVEKTVAAVRDYIAAFLDASLLGKAAAPVLAGPSSEYPDAEVTTQNELLQAKPINGREALELSPAR